MLRHSPAFRQGPRAKLWTGHTGTKQRRGVNPDGAAILADHSDGTATPPIFTTPAWPATAPETLGVRGDLHREIDADLASSANHSGLEAPWRLLADGFSRRNGGRANGQHYLGCFEPERLFLQRGAVDVGPVLGSVSPGAK